MGLSDSGFKCIRVGKASVSEGLVNKMTGGSENKRGERERGVFQLQELKSDIV